MAMADQRTVTSASKSAAPAGDLLNKGEKVTYLPRDGDPAKIKWGGKWFHANAAQMVDNPILLAKARTNKWFHVGEGAPVVVVEETTEPKTPEQYRAHVAAWLKDMTTLDQFERRWAAEEPLRQSCGFGGEDYDVMVRQMLSPKRAQLKQAGLAG